MVTHNKITIPIDFRIKKKIIELRNEGVTYNLITKMTGVSTSSIQRIMKKNSIGLSQSPIKSNRSLFKNPNSKVTEKFLEKVENEMCSNSYATVKEIYDKLYNYDNVKISYKQFLEHVHKFNFTRKNITYFYDSSFSKVNLKRRRDFGKKHDPKDTINHKFDYHSFLLSSSTDEYGFDNLGCRKKGWSKVKNQGKKKILKKNQTSKTLKITRNGGSSYKNNSSRIVGKILKHSNFNVNLIASICLDPNEYICG